jgi:NADPH-dependent ferric siderophore reductase
MSSARAFTLSGAGRTPNAMLMLDEICEHFVEHADVRRDGATAVLDSGEARVEITVADNRLLIDIACESEEAVQAARVMLAEHLFYFAGDEPFELSWANSARQDRPANLHEVTVVSAHDVTPRMRRLILACDDVRPFVGGDMHVRVLVPPSNRTPVWPGIQENGRIAWPTGDDTLLARVYTIRAVDEEHSQLWIDVLQHPMPGVETPGADFARDAQPGQKLALMGPGGGDLPIANTLFLAGDETALPAIARIAAEVPAGTRMKAIIEVESAAEEQLLSTHGSIEIQWLHRSTYRSGAGGGLAAAICDALEDVEAQTFIWVACEKADVRTIRKFLAPKQRDRKQQYLAWYWERS